MTDQAKTNRRPGRREVAAMFDRIAGDYDRLNRILSFGTDLIWRRFAIRAGAVKTGERWLDLAAGSGDVTATGLKRVPGSRWVALDPSPELLRRFRQRPELDTVPAILGAAEAIPFSEGSFHGITIAFGLRNFEERERGLSEIFRVLKPRGRLVILEFLAQDKGGWGAGPLVRFYLDTILPWVGSKVSGDREAYRYLARSSRTFWTRRTLEAKLSAAGFSRIRSQSWMGGAVTLNVAVKAAS